MIISPRAVIISVLPVYLLIVVGALLRKTGVLRHEHDAGVMQVVYSVMLPCFILDKILGAEVLRSGSVVIWGIGLGFTLLLSGLLLAWGMARVIGLERGTGMRTFTLSAGCQNFGFTAVPVLEILWGSSACALLFVHNIGVEAAIWSVGVMIMSGERGVPWRKLLNGPMLAVFLGLSLVALGLDQHLVSPLRKVINMLGVGAFPVAIMITGATMVGLAETEKPSLKIIVSSVLVRLALAPAVILAAAKYLPLVAELRQVLVVQAAMPAAMTPIMLARLYGGRPSIAVQVVLATTVGSLLSLPWIIFWGIQWLGLKPLLP
ncbi:MAG: AEC family transporter [Verrucomicrobia bacterium]|nr:AEC family transporter [Verrucomicrobiota bacterium]